MRGTYTRILRFSANVLMPKQIYMCNVTCDNIQAAFIPFPTRKFVTEEVCNGYKGPSLKQAGKITFPI